MADTKINDLVALTTPVLADVVAIVDDTTGTPVTKKISLDTLSDVYSVNSMSRQAIINGNFDIWQRGTSFTANNDHTADRWKLELGASACTTTRETFTLGQTDVPLEPKYYLRNVVTSSAGAGSYVFINQKIESVRSFAGQNVTVSFWAKADASKNIAIEFVQNFGSGGSPSSAIAEIGSQKIALTTSWAKYTATIAIPSISGKTVGTTHDGYLGLYLWFDAGSNFDARTDTLGQQSGTFEFSQVQLCAGSVALPFQPKSKGQEELDCMRYTEVINYSQRETIGVLFFTDSNSFKCPLKYKVRKRAIPTITLPTTAADNVFSTSSADGSASFVDSSTLTATGIGLNGCIIAGDVMTASYATNDVGNMDIRTANGLIIISAEL